MHWLLQATVALLNILWIGLFLTPQPFSEFEQTDGPDKEEMFCFPPPPVEIPSNKSNNTKATFPAHPATAPGSEPTIMDSDNLGLTGSYPELEQTTRGSYPEVEQTTRGSPPELEQTTRGSYPEVEQTTRGSPPELEQTTRGSYPELEQTTRGSPPELEQMTRGSYPELEPTPVSCCFEFFSGRVPLKHIKGYRKSPPTCPVEAIVIFTATTLCVDPNAAWVKRLLITLDENGRQVNPDDSHSTPAPGSESATMDWVELGLTTQGNPPELEPITPRSPPKLVLTAPRCPQKRMTLYADDCCFSFYPRRLNKNLISSYIMTDSRCTKDGVILMSKKGRRICVDPNVSWVKGIMRSVDGCTT